MSQNTYPRLFDYKMPLLSVIVPVYNVEAYLGRCIDSIINQTYSNLEIILIDDGSTDKSWSICKAYAEKDSRIITRQQSNSGSSVARNTGLDLASGDYIGFVDSDDWIDRNMFQLMLTFLLKNNLHVVECGVVDSKSFKSSFDLKKFSVDSLIETQEEGIKRLLTSNNFSVWRRIYSKEIVQDLRFIPGKIHQDVFFTIDVLNKTKKQGYLPLPLYIYNNENESVIRSPYNAQKMDAKDALYYIVNQTKKYDDKTKAIAKKYLLEGLVNHYNPLFFHQYLDKDYKHRKLLKKEISEQLSIKDGNYSLFSILAKILPCKIYGSILKFNALRIKLKLMLLNQ